jgi:hypothetical protein
MTLSVGTVRNHTPLHYGHTCLDQVNRFTYLGIDIQNNGHFKMAIASRISKANRALFLYKQALKTTGKVNTILTMNIFNKQITPILTYGCPIWGLPTTTNYIDR